MTITDATPTGEKLRSFTLDSFTERMTVREIIRARIWQEVRDYNAKCGEIFHGLVQPTDAVPSRSGGGTLNGYRVKERRAIDWEQQFARACEAFERNGFFLLVADRQAESLDAVFEIRRMRNSHI